MKYCQNCKKELADNAEACPDCAFSFQPKVVMEPDIPSIGLNIASFFIPLIGLICYFSMKAATPKKAKSALVTSLISFGLNIFFSFIYFIIIFTSMPTI